MRRFLVILALLGVLVMPLSAQEIPARVDDNVILNLRTAAGTSSGVISMLAANTPLTVVGRTAGDGWLKVILSDGRSGWVSAGYVTLGGALADVPVLADAPAAPVASQGGAAPAGESVGYVRVPGGWLNLRQEPSVSAAVLAEIPNGTALQIIGRSADGRWLNVAGEPSGWVSALYVRTTGPLPAALPNTASPSAPASSSAAIAPAGNLTGTRNIYLRGKELGNRRGVFTRIGDSISVSEYSLAPIGRGEYNLGAYSRLQSVITTFSSDFNSFLHVSSAAGPGWTAAYAIEPNCNGMTPVECELDAVKPSIALIQLGTNDVQYFSADQFSYNLARVVDICIEKGVVPVLATIPHREGYDVGPFNDVIRSLAAARGVPLWDLKAVMDGLPYRGLSGDGIHPSWPPAGYADAANFASAEALQAGYTARNLSTLQILERTLAALGR